METNETNEKKIEAKSGGGRSSLVKKGLSLSVLTLFSRILGLVREMTKAHFMGTSSYSDAFGVAFMIPNLFRRLFAENSISVAFIPTFKGYLEDCESPKGKKTTQEFVSATFTLVSFLTVCFVTVGIIFAPLILRIFYKEADAESMNEAIILTRIMFPYLTVISIAALFQGILNGLKIFSPSGFTPILFNGIVILATYILTPILTALVTGNTEDLGSWTYWKLILTGNIDDPKIQQMAARSMSIGVITGGLVQTLFQLPFVLKNNWKITFISLRKTFSNPGTKKVLKLIGPTIIGMAAYQLNDIVSSALATRTGAGVYSSLNYSLRLQELILGICAVTIGTVILPDLTGFAKKNDWANFNEMLTQSVRIMAFISIPITFYALCMDENIIKLVFSTGRFDESSAEMTVNVFRFHIIGLFFIAVNRVITPSFYAQLDSISPTIAGLINFALNMALAFILVKPMGGPGIALALTISSFFNTVALFIFLRKNKNIDVGKTVTSTLLYSLRMIVFSVVASVPVLLLRGKILALFDGHSRWISQGLPVIITAAMFALIGLGLMALTRDPLLKSVARKFKRKGRL
ncbi:MAG: murein biosynthesis integral membrane protein MurJ [Treponema sp.]|nr:murein biosynthesis integral membrane protein MurJ [Treponema sp.]